MGNFELYFYSSVLHLRGDKPVKQPHVGESGDVFCWNGEVRLLMHINESRNFIEPFIIQIFEGLEVCLWFLTWSASYSDTAYER
jgi:hypothetical protein